MFLELSIIVTIRVHVNDYEEWIKIFRNLQIHQNTSLRCAHKILYRNARVYTLKTNIKLNTEKKWKVICGIILFIQIAKNKCI